MYECTILTRGYEMSSRGLIAPAVFARYLEHVRWQGFFEGPPAMRNITSPTRRAVVRAQRFELYEGIGHHVSVRISTWIARVGQSSVDFAHRLWREEKGGGEPRLIGLASATIVALDMQHRPTPLPDEVRQAVTPDVVPAPLPLDDEPPSSSGSYPVQIRPGDIDLMQHVNQANYVAFFDDARWQASSRQAYGALSSAAAGRVCAVALDHRDEARLGQEVTVETWASAAASPHEAACVLGFALQDASDGRVLCRGRFDVHH